MLVSLDADALFVLGDLFEVWIGDDLDTSVATDQDAQRVLSALKAASARVALHFMAGNRDFLLSEELLTSHGVRTLADPCVLNAFGQRVLLSHGDGLCLDDVDYQQFRRQVRSPAWQAAFLARPRSERAALARQMRDASQATQAAMVTWADAHADHTRALMAQANTDILVHGHTHRPATHQPAVVGASAATTRHVLSDWDVDAQPARAELLMWSAQGFQRHKVGLF
jgi:UDP-2,3-diacylglucosamine hydrolase